MDSNAYNSQGNHTFYDTTSELVSNNAQSFLVNGPAPNSHTPRNANDIAKNARSFMSSYTTLQNQFLYSDAQLAAISTEPSSNLAGIPSQQEQGKPYYKEKNQTNNASKAAKRKQISCKPLLARKTALRFPVKVRTLLY